MNAIQLERGRHQQRLDESGGALRGMLEFLESALGLLDEMAELYRQLDDQNRRLVNQALFDKVLIEDETEAEPRFKEPFAAIRAAERADRALRAKSEPEDNGSAVLADDALEEVRLIRSLLRVEGSSKDHLVGLVNAYCNLWHRGHGMSSCSASHLRGSHIRRNASMQVAPSA